MAPRRSGIRPEHVLLAAPQAPGAVPGVVALVEDVGADAYISVTVGDGTPIWVRTSAQTPVVEGQQVGLMFDTAHIRWFDAAGIHRRQEGS